MFLSASDAYKVITLSTASNSFPFLSFLILPGGVSVFYINFGW